MFKIVQLPSLNFHGLYTAKCKEIFSVSALITFMKFCVSEEHTRNAVGINYIGFVIPGKTKDKKTNIAA